MAPSTGPQRAGAQVLSPPRRVWPWLAALTALL